MTPWANDVVNALMRSTRIAGQLRPANRGPSAIAGGALALHTATKVLVLPLRPVGNVSSETCRLLTGIMLSQLDGVKNLKAVGGEDVQAALGLEKQKEALGCNNLTCMAEIGGALGVDLVMYGELGTLGAKYNVNLSLIRARDASGAARASKLTDQSEEVMANELPQLVADVVARLNREPG